MALDPRISALHQPKRHRAGWPERRRIEGIERDNEQRLFKFMNILPARRELAWGPRVEVYCAEASEKPLSSYLGTVRL